jgi:hypothetical protein
MPLAVQVLAGLDHLSDLESWHWTGFGWATSIGCSSFRAFGSNLKPQLF